MLWGKCNGMLVYIHADVTLQAFLLLACGKLSILTRNYSTDWMCQASIHFLIFFAGFILIVLRSLVPSLHSYTQNIPGIDKDCKSTAEGK